MGSALFDEQEADKEIIASLIGTNRTLWRELESERAEIRSLREQIKRSYPMSMLVKAESGALLVIHKAEEVTVEAAHELAAQLRTDLQLLEQFIAAHTAAPAEPVQPEQPAAAIEQPTPVEQPAPVEAAPVASEQPAVAEQPAAPAVDPNAVPAPAPVEQPVAVDPNAVPPLQ